MSRRNAISSKDFLTLRKAYEFVLIGRPPVWSMVIILVTIALSAAMAACPPIIIGRIVDAIQRHSPSATISQLSLYITVTVAAGCVALVNSYSCCVFRETLARNVQLAMMRKLSRAKFESVARLMFGQVANRMVGDVRGLCGQFEYSLIPTLSSICSLGATIVAMFRLDARLASVAAACSLIALLPARIMRPHVSQLQISLAAIGDEFYGAIAESNSLAAVAAYRNAVAETKKASYFEDITKRIFNLRVKQNVISGVGGIGSLLSTIVGPSAMLILGVHLTIHGHLSGGTIVALLIFQSRLSGPIGSLGQLQLTAAGMSIVVSRMLEVWDLAEEASGAIEFRPGTLIARDLRATRGEREVLRNVNLRIIAGEHIALVGASGSGKSSLVAMLTRLYDPDQGSICIGDVNLRDFRLDSLRDAVAIVSQDPLIFDMTLRENVAFLASEADDDCLCKALELTGLDGVVARLPEGLDTKLGQRGFRLSGGERQRICLARAIVQNPDILVLDEALTGIDLTTERRILTRLKSHFFGKTMIVITHRLESISSFDRVIALHGGQIRFVGTPEELASYDASIDRDERCGDRDDRLYPDALAHAQ